MFYQFLAAAPSELLNSSIACFRKLLRGNQHRLDPMRVVGELVDAALDLRPEIPD
jgi:hypothetical protein